MAGQLGVQLVGIVSTFVYTAIVTFLIFKVVGMITNGVRVSEDEEAQGLDIVDHEERGYDI
jgi:Amt family ammonium transporter